MSHDKATSVDCQSWISVHGYIVVDWKRTPILLTLDRVVEGWEADNLTSIIMNVARSCEGLSEEKIRESFIAFGTCGVQSFHGVNFGFTFQFINKHALFTIGVHCMAHCTNLAIQTFSDLKSPDM